MPAAMDDPNQQTPLSEDAPVLVTDVVKPLHELLSHSIVDIYIGDTTFPIHEKLLCHHSPVLRNHFYRKGSKADSYGLPDDVPETFSTLVGWLYSGTLAYPVDENAIGPLLEVYLLGEKLQMEKLNDDIVDTIRTYYHSSGSYPTLRRVQYVYENTEDDNPMREMMVGSIARFLTLGESIPKHWDSALRRNGQLAVDIIRAIQEWHLEGRSVPDVRDKEARFGFSGIDSSELASMDGASTMGGSSVRQQSRPG